MRPYTYLHLKSNSEERTTEIARKFASTLRPGDVVSLKGELGVGKTCFVKGLAEGMGVEELVTSPSFTLVHEYRGAVPLYHIDLYRLDDPRTSMEDLGLEEYFFGDGVTAIEWGEKVFGYLPQEYIQVEITFGDGGGREILFRSFGQGWQKRLKEWATNCTF